MSRKSVKETGDISEIDLSKEMGVTKFSDSKEAKIQDLLPTGLPNIDYIIGGGIPFGRMTEIYGKNSSGKCSSKNTYIATKNGYKTIEKLLVEVGQEPYTISKTLEAKLPFINRYGEVEETSHVHLNGKRKVLHITTRTGAEQEITLNHPLLVVAPSGFMIWKEAKELQIGDTLVSRRGDNFYGENDLTPGEAYIVGLIIADGCIAESMRYGLGFTNNSSPVLERYKRYLYSLDYEYAVNEKKGSKGSYSIITRKRFRDYFMAKFDLKDGVAKDKIVPDLVMEGSKKVQQAFLSGYLECEASWQATKGLEVTSASKKLLVQVKLLLQNMGIISFLKEKVVKGYEHNHYYRLSVMGKDFKLLHKVLTFTDKERQATLDYAVTNTVAKDTNHDTVPLGTLREAHLKTVEHSLRSRDDVKVDPRFNTLGRDIIDRMLQKPGDKQVDDLIRALADEHYYYDTITSIEDGGEIPTFDFTVPGTHSFIGNGIINHNSTLAVLLTGMAQKMDVSIVWVDVEGTTEAKRLIECGVDPIKGLYRIAPNEAKHGIAPKATDGKFTVEDVGDRVNGTISAYRQLSSQPLVVIWDSVAGTPAKAQLEGGMEEKQMGIQSKAITKFTTVVGQEILNSPVAFIAINQARDVIGGFMPGQIESAGGNAFKHWASLRLQINKGSAIEEDLRDPFGKTVKNRSRFKGAVKVIKSKMSAPGTKQDFFLSTEHGIRLADNYVELLTSTSYYGLIKRSGSWYNYVTDDGNEIKLYRKDWVDFLDSPEGADVRRELVQKMYMISFPTWYPPLDNVNLDIEKHPDFKGLREKYKSGYDPHRVNTIKEKEVEPTTKPKSKAKEG